VLDALIQMLPSSFANATLWSAAVGEPRAVDAASRHEAREVRNPDPKDLLGQDVIDSLLKVGDLSRKTLREAIVISRRNTPDLVTGSRK